MLSKFQSRVFSFSWAIKSAGRIPGPESNVRCSALSSISFTCVPPISTTSVLFIDPQILILLAETDRLAEPLENAFPFLSGRACARPTFDNLKGEEPEKCHAGEFQIETQIFCDLLNGTSAVELRRKLRFGDGQPQILHSLKSIASVSWNRSRIVISAVAELRKLNETQCRQRPLIDIEVAGERSSEVRKGSLFKRKANAR